MRFCNTFYDFSKIKGQKVVGRVKPQDQRIYRAQIQTTLRPDTEGRSKLVGASGGVFNTRVVIAAADGIISKLDRRKFAKHGGFITITD